MKMLMLTAVLAAIAAPAARAGASQDSSTVVQVKVGLSDLNLSRPAGADIMISRIRRAAHVVCGPTPDSRDLSATSHFKVCITTAIGSAVNEVNAPFVTPAYSHSSHASLLANR